MGLITLYHGSPNKFNDFDKKMFKETTGEAAFGDGIYASDKKKSAKLYGDIIYQIQYNAKNGLSNNRKTITKPTLIKFLKELENLLEFSYIENYTDGKKPTINDFQKVANNLINYSRTDTEIIGDICSATGDDEIIYDLLIKFGYNHAYDKEVAKNIKATNYVLYDIKAIKIIGNQTLNQALNQSHIISTITERLVLHATPNVFNKFDINKVSENAVFNGKSQFGLYFHSVPYDFYKHISEGDYSSIAKYFQGTLGKNGKNIMVCKIIFDEEKWLASRDKMSLPQYLELWNSFDIKYNVNTYLEKRYIEKYKQCDTNRELMYLFSIVFRNFFPKTWKKELSEFLNKKFIFGQYEINNYGGGNLVCNNTNLIEIIDVTNTEYLKELRRI